MKEQTISRDVALNVLNGMKSCRSGPFDRGDITEGLEDLGIRSHDANIEAVLAAQAVDEQSRNAEEGAARIYA